MARCSRDGVAQNWGYLGRFLYSDRNIILLQLTRCFRTRVVKLPSARLKKWDLVRAIILQFPALSILSCPSLAGLRLVRTSISNGRKYPIYWPRGICPLTVLLKHQNGISLSYAAREGRRRPSAAQLLEEMLRGVASR